jgi:hypothetical protein
MTPATRLLSALLATSVVDAAHAATPNVSVHLEVDAAPGCTSQMDLGARILARLRRTRFEDDSPALGVRARFTILPSGNVIADVTLTKAGAKNSSRRVVARSCEQAADAAALIVAVTLDPTSITDAANSSVEPTTTGEGSSATPQSAPLEAEGNAETSSPEGKEPRRDAPPGVEALEASGEPRPASSGTTNRGWSPRLGAHVSAQMFGGLAPALMPGLGVYALAGLDRETLWSPALMLGASHGFDVSVEATGGTATFWLDAASLDACALRVRIRSFETRACASALVGRLSAEATNTTNAAGVVRRPFAALGAAAVMALRIEPTVELTARAALGANLLRDSFEFAPLVFHTVPSVSFSASVGIGLRSR